jgi:predicted transposase YdaD
LENSLTRRLTGARPVELLSVEFGSLERRVPDLVSRLDDGRIFHLEVQSANDLRMPQRMLRYWLLLRERFEGVPVVQHVLYLGEQRCSMAAYIEEESVSYRYHLTDIRDVDEEVLLQSGSAAERMLAILSRTQDQRATIRRILASWMETSGRERADLVGNLMILSGLRRMKGVVAEEAHNMSFTIDYMENETIRGWVEQGIQKGIDQGIRQGLDQGIRQGLDQGQASLLSIQLTKRFGALPPEVEEKLRSGHSEQLKRWALRLMDAPTLDEVFLD